MDPELAVLWDATMERFAPYVGENGEWHRMHTRLVAFLETNKRLPGIGERLYENIELANWVYYQQQYRQRLGPLAVPANAANTNNEQSQEKGEEVAIAVAEPC
jgi:hypothetical protein